MYFVRVYLKLATQGGCKKANITFLDTKLVSLSIHTHYFGFLNQKQPPSQPATN